MGKRILKLRVVVVFYHLHTRFSFTKLLLVISCPFCNLCWIEQEGFVDL